MTAEGEGSGTGGDAETHRRVVVGVDDSAGGLAALRYAVGMARAGHSQLVAVRSWDLGLPRHGGRRHRHRGKHDMTVLLYGGAQQRLESGNLVRHAFQSAAGGIPGNVAVTIETPEGDPGVVLTRMADALGDVLVVGTEAGHMARRLIHGSVSRYCLRRARCPVIVASAPVPGPVRRGRPARPLPITASAGGRR